MKKFFLLILAMMLAAAVCSAGAEGSLVDSVYNSLNPDAGIHLNYTMLVPSMNIEINYDVHAKGISHYQTKTSQGYGATIVDVSCFIGDTSYILKPDTMEAQVVMTLSPTLLKYYNFLGQDELGKLLKKWAGSSGYSIETREVNGIPYTVEVYPAGEDGTENAFYFDYLSRLTYIRDDSLAIIGERFITVNAIDTEINESLLDISAYTVIEK